MKLRTTKNYFGGLFVAALMSCSILAGAARAADVTIGVLDEARLGSGYTKYRTAMDDLERQANVVDAQVEARKILSPDEARRFDELVGIKTTRSKAEEDALQALIKSGTERATQYGTLMGKAPRSDQENADFKKWQEYLVANAKAAGQLEDAAFGLLKTKQDDTDKVYIETANAMVQKVAVEKKLTVLLRKDAVIWFTPTIDITDEVLRRLNQ